ncbi:MAG: hypothetical protein GY926_02575 [bacterium]|nr:hypothetical protein [bacterium]
MNPRINRRFVIIGTALAALVASPALFARPWADERFVMYMPEALVGGNPLLLWDQVMREVTAFIDVGVFRPISRLGFYLEHWLVVRLGVVFGVAPNVGMAVVKLAMVSLLLTTGLLTVNQYRRAAGEGAVWERVSVLLPIVFAGSLVLVNPAVHPLTLFPGLYLGTASVALLVPLWLGRYVPQTPADRGAWLYLAAGLLGAVLASMIELAWLALPLGLVHVVLLVSATAGWNWKRMWEQFSIRLWVALAAGFAVVFLPARFFIAYYCSSGGCYGAAEPDLGLDFLVLMPFRIGSAFVPVGLAAQTRVVARLLTRPSADLLIAVVVAAVAVGLVWWGAKRLNQRSPFGGGSIPTALRSVAPLIGYYVSVIVVASFLAAISSGLQAKGFNPAPWRETGFGWIAWSVLISVGMALLLERVSARGWLAFGLAVVGVVFVAVTVVNREDMRRVGINEEGILHITAGQQLVDFDPADNAARCATMDGLRATAVSDGEVRKMNLIEEYLDQAAHNFYGVVFCDSDSS